MTRAALATLALVALAACSKEKDVEPPAELVEIKATRQIDRLWSASVGGDAPVMRLGLGIGVDDRRVFAAGHGGEVAAFEIKTGRALWRTKTKAAISGAAGVGSGLAVVGSIDGEVIALEIDTGVQRWRVSVGGEVLSAPAVAGQTVVVRTVDGKLHGLALADGKEQWSEQQQVPRLTLRGTARPALAGDVAICGFDNGKVLAVNSADGEVLWETAVAPSRGRTELERLVDIDAPIIVSGDDVFVVGFQGRVAMLARDSGQIWWSREESSYRGLDVDDDAVYVSSAQGEIVSLRRRTGVELWRQSALARRGLSAPAIVGDLVAVADFEGVVHWLEKSSGQIVARSKLSGRVTNAPKVVGGIFLSVDDQGRITALRPRPAAGAQ